MTIHPHPHPHPRRAPAPETLHDVFTSIISSSSSSAPVLVPGAVVQKPKIVDPKKKVDPLTRRLSMIHARKREGWASRVTTTIYSEVASRTETSKTEDPAGRETTTPGPSRTTRVSFSPYNRHHPYNPATRVSSSLKQAVSYSTAGEAAVGTPVRVMRPQGGSGKGDMRSSGESISVVGSTPSLPCTNTPTETQPTPNLQSDTPLTNPRHSAATAGATNLVKSILKRHNSNTPIRIAATVEQGTRENTEEARARLGSPGKGKGARPGLVATNSFVLAARGRVQGAVKVGTEDAEKEGEVPGSDDTVSDRSEEGGDAGDKQISGSADGKERGLPESRETSEENDARSNNVDSLLDVIIHEADDLLAVEDAYSLIQVRYRSLFAANATAPTLDQSVLDSALDSFRVRSSDMFRAFLRDITRLVGTPISSIPPPVLDSSPPPAGHLDPTRTVVTPSPSPDGKHRLTNFTRRGKQPARPPASPTLGIARVSTGPPPSPKLTRQGYSDSEVRYRRALAGVGQASLRFLAFVLHRAELHQCLSDPDVTSLISAVLVIPTTPKLYTPNPKKSYALAMYSLCHLQVPIACIQPIKEKFMQVITYGLGDGGVKCWGAGTGKQETEGGNVKARLECFAAMANAHVQYPSLFIPRHKEYLPLIFTALIDGQAGIKARAGMALCGFVKGRINWLREMDKAVKDCQAVDGQEVDKVNFDAAKHDWKVARRVAAESEVSAQEFLMTTVKQTRADAERIAVWDAVVALLTKAVATDPLWACSIWACIVTLLGQAYLREHKRYRQMNAVVLSILASQEEQESHAGRTTLCVLAWNHTIHALFTHRAREYIDEATATPRRYFDLDYSVSGEKTMNAILSLPAEAREKEIAGSADVAEIVTNEAGKRELLRKDTPANRIWLESCTKSLTPVVYAYTGAILRSTPAPTGQGKSIPEPAAASSIRLQRLETVFDKVLMEFLPSMMASKALDGIKIEAWEILHAVVDHTPSSKLPSWSMKRLLYDGFFRNDSHNKEIAGVYRDGICLDAAVEIAAGGVQASDIPAWNTEEICLKFVGGFGALFLDAVKGLAGIQRVEDTGGWMSVAGGTDRLPLLPKRLSEIWESLLTHVSRQKTDGRAHQYLAEITRILVDLYKADVAAYTPLSYEHHPAYNPQVRRSEMCRYLAETANRILPDNAFSQTRLTLNNSDTLANAAPNIISADHSGNPTSAGYLLHHVTNSLADSSNTSAEGIASYLNLFSYLLSLTITGSGGKRTLGQTTYALTTLTQSTLNPEITRGIWEILCQSWCSTLERHSTGTDGGSGPSHTLNLLISLLCLPLSLCTQQAATWSKGWTRSWHALFSTAYARSETRRLGYFTSIVEPICQSVLAQEPQRAAIITSENVWSCFEALTFKMDNAFSGTGTGASSFFALVDHLTLRYSAENTKLSQLVSAALACANFKSLESDIVQRLWYVALSAHHSPLSNEAETQLTKVIRAEMNASDAQVAQVLGPVSPVFEKLLSSRLVQDHNSFRTMWNVTFGKVEISEQEIPTGLLSLLLERWQVDNTAFDMPAWTKAREESQAARVAVTAIDYEADNSDEMEESQRFAENQASRCRPARNARYLEAASSIASGSIRHVTPHEATVATGNQALVLKERTAGKRTAKKSRKRSRTSEPKEDEVSGSARHVSLRSEGKSSRETAASGSVRHVSLRSEGKSYKETAGPHPSKRRKMQHTGDQTASSMHARQDVSASSGKRHNRKGVVNANRHETPAQEDDAMDEIEAVLSAPDQPEDRVEVVIMSQERRRKGDLMRTDERDDDCPAEPNEVVKRRSSTRAVAKFVSTGADPMQVPLPPKDVRPNQRDILTLIQEAAHMKSTISQLERPEINGLMAALEELRSTSVIALNERLTENQSRT